METEEYQQPLDPPKKNSHPLNEFTTQNCMVMCFPEIFFNGKGHQTRTDKL